MRNILFTVFIYLICSISVSSQESSGIQFKSITNGLGFYKLEKIKGKSGVSASFQITFQINNHLLASSFAVGYGVLNENEVLKNTIHAYVDINALYGRAFELSDNFAFDLFSGIGYIEQTKLKSDKQGVSLNIPVRAKFMYVASQRTQLGILSQYNFNKKNNIYMYQFFLQFQF
ncbi:hypothetical protein [Psychroserpens algicola]|uniref:hypothetical protein n=1 Tax=Psychroserpens algicola TaxID=1719034 RepID=UPI001954541A|nr:hypothetical protein [Psychroserpens algicola]